MILRKCFNCQHNYVTKNWDDIKCPYCGVYNVYKKGEKNMFKIIICATNNGTHVSGTKEEIKKAYLSIVRTVILSEALSAAEIVDITLEGIRQGEKETDTDWVL